MKKGKSFSEAVHDVRLLVLLIALSVWAVIGAQWLLLALLLAVLAYFIYRIVADWKKR